MSNKTIVADWRIVTAVIAAIVILEIAAMANGINGKLFSLVLVILAGLGGLVIPNPFKTT